MTVTFDAEERAIRLTFGDAVRAARQATNADALLDAINSGSLQRVMQQVPIDEMRDVLQGAGEAIRQSIAKSAVDASATDAGVSWVFDKVDPRAVLWAQENTATMVTRVTEQSRLAIRQAVSTYLKADIDRTTVRRLIRSEIGLNERDTKTALRIRDTVYRDHVERGRPPRDAARIADGRANIYRQTALERRAVTIARTETRIAQSRGRRLSWQQADERGLVKLDQYGARWSAAPGACPICSGLDGTIVAANASFPDVGQEPAHPRCRCSVSLVPPGYPGWT